MRVSGLGCRGMNRISGTPTRKAVSDVLHAMPRHLICIPTFRTSRFHGFQGTGVCPKALDALDLPSLDQSKPCTLHSR